MMEVEGKVFTGDGKASEFLELEPYRDFLTGFLGQPPFPGTLNIRTDGETGEIKEEARSERLEPFKHEDKSYGGITVYRVKVEGIEAGLLEIDRTHYGEDVVEIVAGTKLREELGVEDGDTVTVNTF